MTYFLSNVVGNYCSFISRPITYKCVKQYSERGGRGYCWTVRKGPKLLSERSRKYAILPRDIDLEHDVSTIN